MDCPRCHSELVAEMHLAIEVDRCPSCNGRWLDHHELDELEATTGASEAERRATITFGERKSELDCPVCQKLMTSFNYRAYNFEMDACTDEHGYWLDAGEDGRVRDIVEERVRGLERSASAEAAWGRFLGGLKGGGGLFKRRK